MSLDRTTNPLNLRHWLGDMEADYVYTLGVAGEKFFKEIKENERIMGGICPRCNKVITVPDPGSTIDRMIYALGDDEYNKPALEEQPRLERVRLLLPQLGPRNPSDRAHRPVLPPLTSRQR